MDWGGVEADWEGVEADRGGTDVDRGGSCVVDWVGIGMWIGEELRWNVDWGELEAEGGLGKT